MNNFHELLVLLVRRWRIIVWTTIICLAIAIVMAYRPDPIYRSSGTILSERPEISSELVTSTVEGLFEQRLQIIRRRVITGDNLRPIIEKYGLYPEIPESRRSSYMKDAFSMEQVDPITGEPSEGSDAFTLHFDYGDPDTARNVAEELLNLFLEDNRRRRTETAEDTERFFADETSRLEEAVQASEARLAQFKSENRGLLPEDIDRNRGRVERITLEIPGFQADIRAAQEQRQVLQVEVDKLSGGTELSLARTELNVALQQYSEDHPDVRRLRRTISVLEAAEASGDIDPELRTARARLAATDREIAAAQASVRERRREITELEAQQAMAEEVERKLSELQREHEFLIGEYESIRQRRAQAEIASNLELEDKGERYSVIRQPSVPGSPYYPNRLGIILIGLLFAFGGSAGLVALRENMDSTVRGAHDVVSALDAPPIATIPIMLNREDSRQRFLKIARHAVALLVVSVGTYGMIISGP